MDVLRLRILTEKSTMKFGRYFDFTVKYLLDTTQYSYLRWVYFNCSMISFMDNILDKIKILPEFRIDKPGKAPEKVKELFQVLYPHHQQLGVEGIVVRRTVKRALKAKGNARRARGSIYFSKLSLQRRNHGH